ncbi:hypothetical protein D9758_004507 [Tetrapyrgos nigripes]|uniref:FAD-binding PCMH-type domain-containing protein n=1 Tax=Tetrapyrgos nigripes TaxID=182062 RepID=A0A8H5GMX5_9AGAR|nr:hypothetical protein D9758_004507 [Tetrapyrgos nigripes]
MSLSSWRPLLAHRVRFCPAPVKNFSATDSPVPPESACYPESNPSGNCTDVQTNAFIGTWRSDQPGAMQAPNLEAFVFPNGTIEACYLNTTLGFPCEQGSVPPIGVDARTVEDIQAGVKFAVDHNLRLVIHNTGHDYLARSVARGSFMIWTHNMKNITASSTFVPEGAPENETYHVLTLDAGVQWHEAYDAAHADGRFILGGITPGGTHGLGVDNVVQFTIVTASGDHLTANSYLNSDLFWAVRGGGGGTYGVVTSVTYRTHENFPLTVTLLNCNLSSPAVKRDILTEYLKLWPGLSDEGWGAYVLMNTPTTLSLYVVSPHVSLADTNATLTPFLDFVRNAQEDAVIQMLPFDEFYSFYSAFFASPDPVEGLNLEIFGRMIPRETFDDRDKMVDVIMSLESVQLLQVAGGQVSQIDPDSAGVNPAWRKAIMLMNAGLTWESGLTGDEYKAIQGKLKDGLALLESLVPGGGDYLNEVRF